MRKTISICITLLLAATSACSFTTDFDLPQDTSENQDTGGLQDTDTTDDLDCGGCLVEGICLPDGVINPQNFCEHCDSAASQTEWSNRDGQACDDGLFCTVNDLCTESVCTGDARVCDDSIDCNGQETCDEVIGACTLGTTECVSGEVCQPQQDVCVPTCSGCLIDGLCYIDGEPESTDGCKKCDVSNSREFWSWVADDTPCASDFCTQNALCSAGQCTGGDSRVCDDGIDCNGTETCDEANNRCNSGTPTCAVDEACDFNSGECVPFCGDCYIGNTCYLDGVDNPAEECQTCDIAQDQADWTDKLDTTPCALGECTAGICGP